MPEMHFHVRWPDGSTQRCYSPSLVIEDFFAPGESFQLAEFVERSRSALRIASERVRLKYGFECRRALAQIADIEAAAARFGAEEEVVIGSFERAAQPGATQP
jgi:uncharacterized repeat protein (TIGR04042 family)